MEIKWLNPDASFEKLILVGDIGGTNTNLGIVGYKNEKYTIILETVWSSSSLSGLVEPLAETLKLAKEHSPHLQPTQCCISAAGPVSNNRCVMTNLKWSIDGNDLSTTIGIPVLVINDFVAISYGILTLDTEDPSQIYKLPHLDGSTPNPAPATKAVIGPGTGMGVSFLAFDGKEHIPASSEGGHIAFAPFDEDSISFWNYLREKSGGSPVVEHFVSGIGIINLYEWWKHTKGIPNNAAFEKIEATPEHDRPKYISRASDTDPVAAEMMRLFVKMLARFASDVSTLLLPFGGLYLAGGTVQKDLRWLERDSLFMKYFEKNNNPNIPPLLQKTPVYIIKDYSISLYGAANAGFHLFK